MIFVIAEKGRFDFFLMAVRILPVCCEILVVLLVNMMKLSILESFVALLIVRIDNSVQIDHRIRLMWLNIVGNIC